MWVKAVDWFLPRARLNMLPGLLNLLPTHSASKCYTGQHMAHEDQRKKMTIREASKRLGYALQTTYRLIWAGELRAQKEFNGRWQVSKEAVEKRLAERLARCE